MTKQIIINSLTEKYGDFVSFINELTTDKYLYSNKGKWTAEQQLEHIILCVKPLVQVFSMDKENIRKTFGHTDKEGRSYEVLLNEYIGKLKSGGKAPERFVPKKSFSVTKEPLLNTLQDLVKELSLLIDEFSEQELNSLLIPHPLLGSLTLREMLYNAIYHVEHHQNLAKQNLEIT